MKFILSYAVCFFAYNLTLQANGNPDRGCWGNRSLAVNLFGLSVVQIDLILKELPKFS